MLLSINKRINGRKKAIHEAVFNTQLIKKLKEEKKLAIKPYPVAVALPLIFLIIEY
jgi:hypothetical protein